MFPGLSSSAPPSHGFSIQTDTCGTSSAELRSFRWAPDPYTLHSCLKPHVPEHVQTRGAISSPRLTSGRQGGGLEGGGWSSAEDRIGKSPRAQRYVNPTHQYFDFWLFIINPFTQGLNFKSLQIFESKRGLTYESEWYENPARKHYCLILQFTHSLSDLFKHLLSTFYVPGIVQGSGFNND